MPPDTIPDDALLARLRDVIGRRHVLTGARATRRYRKGYRFGDGTVLAAACPGTLLELWQVLQATVEFSPGSRRKPTRCCRRRSSREGSC